MSLGATGGCKTVICKESDPGIALPSETVSLYIVFTEGQILNGPLPDKVLGLQLYAYLLEFPPLIFTDSEIHSPRQIVSLVLFISTNIGQLEIVNAWLLDNW